MTKIKCIAVAAILSLMSVTLWAQPLYRTQIAPYSQRSDAVKGEHSTSALYVEYTPTLSSESGGNSLYHFSFTYPAQWSDGLITLHLENLPSASILVVNDQAVAALSDIFTPLDIDITGYLHQGANSIDVVALGGVAQVVDSALQRAERTPFSGSYISQQGALHIRDFSLSLHPNSEGNGGYLTLNVIVANLHSQPRDMEIGFDIYAPDGKLIEYDFSKREIAGSGVDTISFSRPIKGTEAFQWGVNGQRTTRKGVGALQSPLYSVTLYTRLGGVLREYIPFKVGYTDFNIDQSGVLTSFGEKIDIVPASASAAATPELTQELLTQLRSKGVNTLITDYAQPSFFYQAADKMGFLVVDNISINAPQQRDNRAVGGTPSNDPTLEEEYLSRGKAAYYRSRNHTSVVAYSLGAESGNGYNMYRLYELLKSLEPSRPIIYQGSDGEWNSDTLKLD